LSLPLKSPFQLLELRQSKLLHPLHSLQADIVVLATGYTPLAKTLLPTDDLRVSGTCCLFPANSCWLARAASSCWPAAAGERQSL